MFWDVRKKIAQRAVDSCVRDVQKSGLPSALGERGSAAYLSSMLVSRHLYIQLFFGKRRFIRSSVVGIWGRDKPIFATLVVLMSASLSPILGVDEDHMSNLVRWQLLSIPKAWHERLIDLTGALVEEAGNFPFQSNSIFSFMKSVSNGMPGHENRTGIVGGMMFHNLYLAHVADARELFGRFISEADA